MTTDLLYQVLKARIQAGAYPLGTPLPTEQALGAEHKAARGTVRAALQRLVDEGFLYLGEGRKRYVARQQPLRMEKLRLASRHYENGRARAERSPSFGKYLRALGQEPEDIILRSPARVPCHALAEEPRLSPAFVSEELRIAADAPVYWLERLRLAKDQPLALQWAVIPANLLRKDESPVNYLYPGGLTEFYHKHDLIRRRVQTACTPARASKTEAEYLRLGAGAPLVEERRVSYCLKPRTHKEVPYEYLLTLYTERVELCFEWLDAAEAAAGRGGR